MLMLGDVDGNEDGEEDEPDPPALRFRPLFVRRRLPPPPREEELLPLIFQDKMAIWDGRWE